MFSVVSYVLEYLRLWSCRVTPGQVPGVKEEDVNNNITDDDEDDDDSVGQYHDWLNDENSNNCYDDCDD
ncbi:hypothetical protein EVAR_10794_1 [Eumeta japonica]|uniref:Uncharacterized protein n=1 Tax=Eumeta variegata TaxID=151549 RepID=A0A4C1W631_EUMVA|nr:hypothetical protein EVAR_10794_1 [Eumeta japonica]